MFFGRGISICAQGFVRFSFGSVVAGFFGLGFLDKGLPLTLGGFGIEEWVREPEALPATLVVGVVPIAASGGDSKNASNSITCHP